MSGGSMGQMMQAVNSFFDWSTGSEEFVKEGEALDEDHPLVKRHPEHFRAFETRPVPQEKATKRAAAK
jgi:hypothetical protein